MYNYARKQHDFVLIVFILTFSSRVRSKEKKVKKFENIDSVINENVLFNYS